MKYLYALLAATLAGCSTQDYYRGRVTVDGKATAQVHRVQDGVEKPVTRLYVVEGDGKVEVQTVKPYLKIEGGIATPVAKGEDVVEEPGAVLILPAPGNLSAAPAPEGDCPGGVCQPPQGQNAPNCPTGDCPLKAPAERGSAGESQPCPNVYTGCSGKPGGSCPTPCGQLPAYKGKPSWPCGVDLFGGLKSKVDGLLAAPKPDACGKPVYKRPDCPRGPAVVPMPWQSCPEKE